MNNKTRKFQKRVEDFVCDKCGYSVRGNGFTNHCPHCLWSKHVDINPGDREAICKGMMEPVNAVKEGENYILEHKCQNCGLERRKKLFAEDDFDAFINIAKSKGSLL